MPPRTRATKTTKGLKENIGVVQNSKLKTVNKQTKSARKVLADKTNSASDDNASIEVPKKVSQKPSNVVKKTKDVETCSADRPRRDRRLPNRFVENPVLKNLSNSKENASTTPVSKTDKAHSLAKNSSDSVSPFKTPQKDVITENRPRRICRLPSKFEDHSISPSKFISVQPVHASTPITQKNVRISKTNSEDKSSTDKTPTNVPLSKKSPTRNVKKSTKITGADTNNNAKRGRTLRNKKTNDKTSETTANKKITIPPKLLSPKRKKLSPVKKPFNKSMSYRILDDKKKSSKTDADVYEFTYDPNEEPPPQKKKRKRVVKKKPAKPKTVVFSNNYDKNLSKALTTLKNVVSKNQTQTQIKNAVVGKDQKSNTINPPRIIIDESVKSTNLTDKTTDNYNSVQVEDIAADFEPSIVHHEIDYSPVNSPCRPKTPTLHTATNDSIEKPVNNNDPLNLQDGLSFFDENPVASSSMNTSVRNPLATPWRVEFENLPVKWPVNSYVKPNMTPAVECSFINFNDKKKHVYTNMLPETDNSMPQIVENTTPNLKQTSIMSFIREVVEKNDKKKKRSSTPKKTKSDDINTSANNPNDLNKTPTETTSKKITDNASTHNSNIFDECSGMEHILDAKENTPNNDENSTNKENSRESLKRKNDSDPNVVPTKTPRKDNDITLFGFDDSENQDQENVSPKKIDTRKHGLRSRDRAVLKELNDQAGPMRAIVPITAKSVLTSEVNKLYEEMKSASDAPAFTEKIPMENIEATNVNEVSVSDDVLDDDSQSVHLFEDLEVVHHLKPTRKSYGKAKKVTFQQNSSDSDSQTNDADPDQSYYEDDLGDLTFEMPSIKQRKPSKKKPTKKQTLKKKEDAEAEAWAAGFNSMCEDIDDFDLVVE